MRLTIMKKSLFVLLVYSTLLTLSEVAYRAVFHISQLNVRQTAEAFVLIAVVAALYLFARHRVSRVAIFIFFAASMIANNVHYAVYQSWITGINYWLMFKEITEVGNAGASMLQLVWLPALWGLAESALFFSLSKFRRQTHRAADWVFSLAIALIIGRSFKTTQEHGISPKPTYSRIKANYFSFGYFAGRILPYQIFHLSKVPVYSHPAPAKTASADSPQNIILIMGESESAAHLKMFGYERDTSPFIGSLKNQPSAIVLPAYSAGMMTAVSLPSFFNAIAHANGFEQISSGKTNMFRLAKEQGYQTYFYSAQASNEMAIFNLIGQRWIDHLVQPTQMGYSGSQNMPDDKLIPLFEQIDLTQGKHFIVLHQRASHIPYGALLAPQDNVFGTNTALDKYDNTIRKTDQFIQSVLTRLQRQPENNWLFAYTSDHGQYVHHDAYNQGTNHPDNYTVPLVLYSPHPPTQQLAQRTFAPCATAYHQQLATLLVHSMGYDMPVSGCTEGYVTGNLLTGDVGSLKIERGKVQFVAPK